MFDLNWSGMLQSIIRLIIAALCANIIGLAFSSKRRHTMINILILIAMGAVLFTILAVQRFMLLHDALNITVMAMTTVFAAAMLLRHRGSSFGLKAAVAVWIAGATGMAIGNGFYFPSILISVISFYLINQIKEKSENDVTHLTGEE